MAQDKISMPSSTAGITRYFEEYKSNFQFKPGYVVLMCIVVMAIVLLLHVYGGGLITL